MFLLCFNNTLSNKSSVIMVNLAFCVIFHAKIYPNDPKFSNRYVCATSVDPDRTASRA